MVRSRLGQAAQAAATLLAVAFLAAVVAVATADPHSAAAGRAVEQHVGGVNGQLHGQLTALGIAAVGLDVLLGPVDALDDDLALGGDHPQHLAGTALLGVITGDHLDQVFFPDVHGLFTPVSGR